MSARQDALTETSSCSFEQADDAYTLWSLFDNSSARIAHLDLELRLMGSNAGFADVFGLSVEELPGVPLVDLVHARVKDTLTRRLLSLARGERSRFSDRIATLTSTGRTCTELTGIAVTDDAGRIDSLVVLLELEPEAAADAAEPAPTDARKPLTRMEAQVLEGVAAGMSTVQLASKLFLSRGGVEYHVSALMKNLEAANRSELVSRAYSIGLFSAGSWPPQVLDFVE
ncbi:helix-turn-helix transcriptional regulator [Streptomyces sp. NBC_00669]|uniref:LuxR C-terminal-related transcriptional regulator n=1 Tax=unclassified Streptomyces TaxID=2593676 RepID=UPI002E337E7E|nr:LuxR C-terminal-related transcriptional regulator [Streptomyces sp. NBC_00669]